MITIEKEPNQQFINKLPNAFIERVKYILNKTKNSIMTNFELLLSSQNLPLDSSKQEGDREDCDKLPPKVEVWLEDYMSKSSGKTSRTKWIYRIA